MRDLTPYLNQLVIRQSVGGSADVFRTNVGESGPPQYIDTEKMTILNRTASSVLRGQGMKGNSQDLANQVYTAAITDWNVESDDVKNGVNPEEISGLVESAYHNALNDRRQDGARVRDLTPYLNQLVIRQSVGGSADVFRTNVGESGPPQYIDTEKMAVLNNFASTSLKRQGFKGNSQDLANQVYTAAITDWNVESDDVKKEWERS